MKSVLFYKKLFYSLKKRKDILIKRHNLEYKRGKFAFLKIFSASIRKTDKIIMVCAGSHGEEISGPLTILKYGNKIIDYVHKNGLKIIIYPLINPSGFELGLRNNIDGDEGEAGNNDFVRYELKSGKLVDDLKSSNVFKKWHWSSDKKLKIKLPKETELLHRLLKKDPLRQVVAAIDLHQDYITKTRISAAYHYAFGKLSVYNNIVEKLRKILPILKNKHIGAGYGGDALKSDKNGFIVRYDGSWLDLMHRFGAEYCVAAETTGRTSLNKAIEANLIWIFEITEIAKKRVKQ